MIGHTRVALMVALGSLVVAEAQAQPCLLPGIAPAALSGSRNLVARRALCPRLLRDGKDMARYLEAFPKSKYGIFRTRANNRYYLDDRKDVIKNTIRGGHAWEGSIRALLRKYVRRGSTVLDVGAHIGTHAVDLGRIVGPKGRVYAFEPQKKLYRELVWNLRLNKVTKTVLPLRFALGTKNTVIEMNRATPGNEGGTGVGKGGDKAELRTLDSFRFKNLSLLKIDVEGFEDPVLKGAKKTIAAQRPVILIEVQGGYDLDRAPRGRQRNGWATIDLLSRLGYRVHRVGIHDFLALPRKRGTRRPLSFQRTFTLKDRYFHTQIGKLDKTSVRTTGRAGTLLYGPYVYLPAGAYVIRWKGSCEGAGKVTFDVVSRRAKTTHRTRTLTVTPKRGRHTVASVAFTLPREVADIEYRVIIHGAAKLTINEVELLRSAR